MKSPLGKLGFKLPGKGREGKNKSDYSSSTHNDDVAQASQDMQDMRDCYDSLLSAAAAIANSAYEFSESLGEMGCCLKEKYGLHDNEESGNALLMLGKVQLELQKLVDGYRSHVSLTITNPSESLLTDLRNVEDMKKLCDEKRSVYEYMVAQEKEKGRRKIDKGEKFTLEQLQRARDEYDENATLFVFRMKSLKQGQSRNLLTLAARHHASQLNFFQKGLKSLEAADPHVRDVAEKQHIDYYFKGLDDKEIQFNLDERNDAHVIKEEGELSFDYRYSRQEPGIPAPRDSMEMDEDEISFPQPSTTSYSENQGRQQRSSSYSAPIFTERKNEGPERHKATPQKTIKFNACVLPTPNDAKARISLPGPPVNAPEITGLTNSLWHSSPMEQWKQDKDTNGSKLLPTLGEKTNSSSAQLPPPLAEVLTVPQRDMYDSSERKNVRLSYSGPISTKTSSKTTLSATLPSPRGDLSKTNTGLLYSNPTKVSPSSSPPPVLSPRISELHELPRPPANASTRHGKSTSLIGHSAPLVSVPEDARGSKVSSSGSKLASPLPTPPVVMSRSYSIPSRGQRTMTIYASKFLESSKVIHPEQVESPPLTPLSISNMQPTPVLAAHLERYKGVS